MLALNQVMEGGKPMKFFLMVFSKYENCWRLSSVHGPYENDRVAEEEIERLWPNDKKKQFLILDSQQLETLRKARI